MWLMECPNFDEGLIRPIVAEEGRVVLFCDSADCIWLHPEDVSSVEAIYASGPDWKVAPDAHMTPGKTRWATKEDVPQEWLDRFEWHDG